MKPIKIKRGTKRGDPNRGFAVATQVDQADAAVAGAQAGLDNLGNQIELQHATIAQVEAVRASTEAQELQARQELERQQSLSQTGSGTRQKLEQATAVDAKAQADVLASRAVVAAQRHQLDVLLGTRKQRAADLEGARASLAAAKLYKETQLTIVLPGQIVDISIDSFPAERIARLRPGRPRPRQ